jgi:hypothetical protein
MKEYRVRKEGNEYWIVEHAPGGPIPRERFETLLAATARLDALQKTEEMIEQRSWTAPPSGSR